MKKMKRTLALLLGLVMTVSTAAVPSFATESSNIEVVANDVENTGSATEVFSDIDAGAWYADAVQYVHEHNIMSGNSNLFEPGKVVTKAMVVTTLYRMAGSPEVTDYRACDELIDVKEGQWYTDALCWAYNHEIASGNNNTKKFNVNDAVTREQLAAFFYRYAQYADFATTQKGDLSSLLNVEQVSSYAEEAIVWAVGAGLVSGVKKSDEGGKTSYDLAPKAGATRAQLASILMRFCEEYGVFEEEPSTVPGEITGTTTEAAGLVSTKPRYFPITMFNYDGLGMNELTRQKEIEANIDNLAGMDEWDGFYFFQQEWSDEEKNPSYDYSAYVHEKAISYTKVEESSFEAGASYILVSNFKSGQTYAVGKFVSDDEGRLDKAELVTKDTLEPSDVPNAVVWQCDDAGRLYYTEQGVNYYININNCAHPAHGTNDQKHAHTVGVTTDVNTAAKLQTTSNVTSATGDGIFFVFDADACNGNGVYLNMVDNATDSQFGGWWEGSDGSTFRLYKQEESLGAVIEERNPYVYSQISNGSEAEETPYILVSKPDDTNDYNYAIGRIIDVSGQVDTLDSIGHVMSGEKVDGTTSKVDILESESALIWQYDADGYVYYTEGDTNYYINIICNCTTEAEHQATRHSVEFVTEKENCAKIQTTSNVNTSGTDGIFYIYDADACLKDTAPATNLALNKTVTASNTLASCPPSNLVDGDTNNRWATDDLSWIDQSTGDIPDHYVTIDLGEKSVITSVRLLAEDSESYYQNLGKFKIEGSNDGSEYTLIYDAPDKINTGGYDLDYTVELPSAVEYRYVRITIENLTAKTDSHDTWPSASLREVEIYGYVEDTTLALNKTVTVSSAHANTPAANAVDGDLDTRWGTEEFANPHSWVCEDGDIDDQWLKVDLGERKAITGFRIATELGGDLNQNIGQFLIEGSNDDKTYSEIYQSEDLSGSGGFDLDYSFDLASDVQYRYIKLTVQKLTVETDEHDVYPTVSLREFEVHGRELVNRADAGGCYLNLIDRYNGYFGGWHNGGTWCRFNLYAPLTLKTDTGRMETADYNRWTGSFGWEPTQIDNPLGGYLTEVNDVGSSPTGSSNNIINGKKGNRLFNNLVKSELDAEGNIQFNVIEPGLFTLEENEHKEVYTNVEMPFEYDPATGVYTFDSSSMSARFSGGQAANNTTLVYKDAGQVADQTYGDGSSTMWMPFNDKDSLVAENGFTKDDMDYHFGMSFNIPFFMTADGRLPGGQNNPIVFDFSGDDDVWVFIDGQLVLDMGGIHNNLHGRIEFQDIVNDQNEVVSSGRWSIDWDSSVNTAQQEASYVDGAPTEGQLFASAANTNDGKLSMTRAAFAETEVHTLTVFYMERGAGSSNNKMSFNLPVRDSVNVMKEINPLNTSDEPLSSEMMEYVNRRDFRFKLTNGGAAVANRNYYLMDIRGMYLQTLQTNANGEFTLKNGQTAKFVGPISPGDSYVVTELEPATTAWAEPDWYSVARLTKPEARDSAEEDPIVTENPTESTGWACTEIVVPAQTPLTDAGSAFPNYMEMINVRCTNTLDLSGEPEINDDRIVIDYGLPVEIDVFANDIVPDSVELDYEGMTMSADGIGEYGQAEYDSTTRKITYTLSKQLTSAEKFTYTVDYTNGEGESGTKSADIWIMPATSMYYEEDFGFVTYTGAWNAVNEGESNSHQEPGVVSTVGDSPYGSDVAYLDDGADSNGTSKYVQTTASEGAGFTYTFTGTGTTFFARTTNNSGYMKVDIECLNSDQTTTYVDQWRRDTSYKTDDDSTTLYNIPVFSWMAEEYGTYKVTVSLAKLVTSPKTGEQLYGTEFWLDGIKIFEPLDGSSENVLEVTSAYAEDGESNVEVVTLRNKIIHNQMVYNEETKSYEWSEQDEAAGNFVVFTDYKKTEDGEGYDTESQVIVLAEDYISRGPKEEVYLQSGQSVSFALKEWDPNGAHVFLGIKAPMGAGTVLVNGNELSINNSVDGYYEISDYQDFVNENAKFVITAGADSLISLTTIKVTGGTEFTIISDLNQEIENVALTADTKAMVNAVKAVPEHPYVADDWGGVTDSAHQIGAINDNTVDTNNYYDFGNGTYRTSLYVEMDLQQSYDLDTIKLYRYWSGGRTYDATVIAVSEDAEFTNPTIVYNSDTKNVHGLGIGSDAKYQETSNGKSFTVGTSARYIRIYNYGNSANCSNHIVEVQAFLADGTTNVALASNGTTAKTMVTEVKAADAYEYVAAEHGGNTDSSVQIDKINNGNTTLNDYFDYGNDKLKESIYLELDLKKSYRLSEIALYRYWDGGRVYGPTVIAVSDNEDFSDPTIIYNSDTENVHGLGAGNDSTYTETSSGESFAIPKGTVARYVRVYTYGRPKPGEETKNFNTNHVVEVEVYAIVNGATAGDASDAAVNIDIDVTGYEGGDALPGASSEV